VQFAETQLCLQTSVLPPGAEVSQRPKQWSFLLVCAGSGYLLSLLSTRQSEALEPGALVCVPAGSQVCVRASHLNQLTFCQFGVSPAELPGFFTLAEQRALAQAARERIAPWIVSSKDACIPQFAAVCGARERESALTLRGEMLRLAAKVLSDVARPSEITLDGDQDARKRFAGLMGRVSERELLSRTPSDLAKACGCGVRHFRRLFKEYMGVSFQEQQIQFRLGAAKQLLRDTDAKVIDVAGECGFRNLGHFNAIFKRLVGATPSAWRLAAASEGSGRKHRKPAACPNPLPVSRAKDDDSVNKGRGMPRTPAEEGLERGVQATSSIESVQINSPDPAIQALKRLQGGAPGPVRGSTSP